MKNRQDKEPSVPKHKHCPVCGINVGKDEMFCSDQCEREYVKMGNRRKYALLLASSFPAIVIIVIFILPRIL